MKYTKDPYYLNSDLKNLKKNNKQILQEDFLSLADKLRLEKSSSIYEVGFDFGQRLDYLKNDFDNCGGVEFDPTFGLFKKHYNLFDNGWKIHFTQLDFWNPIPRDLCFTYHFLDLFNEEDRNQLLEKMKVFKKIYMVEDCDLNFEQYKEDGIYVVTNEQLDDSEGDQKSNKAELPNFKSLFSGSDKTGKFTEDIGEIPTGEDD